MVFSEYLAAIENKQHADRTKEVLDWVGAAFPELAPKIAWNQPMFTAHGTFIIGFSLAAKHLAVSPERQGIKYFMEEIEAAGYEQSKMLFRIKWEEPVNFSLLERIIRYNLSDKSTCKTFWRKS